MIYRSEIFSISTRNWAFHISSVASCGATRIPHSYWNLYTSIRRAVPSFCGNLWGQGNMVSRFQRPKI